MTKNYHATLFVLLRSRRALFQHKFELKINYILHHHIGQTVFCCHGSSRVGWPSASVPRGVSWDGWEVRLLAWQGLSRKRYRTCQNTGTQLSPVPSHWWLLLAPTVPWCTNIVGGPRIARSSWPRGSARLKSVPSIALVSTSWLSTVKRPARFSSLNDFFLRVNIMFPKTIKISLLKIVSLHKKIVIYREWWQNLRKDWFLSFS